MRQDLHLFIGGKEVDFNADPKILFNFKETELRNPTIVKNTFTKTINIDSTPANDDIFNHFWNLERRQAGSYFNAMAKVRFELYNNGMLIQNGYVRLDNVKTSNHRVQYQVSLFGGLGDFFYSLAYAPDSDSKKTLASLSYITDDLPTEPDFDFNITKENVWEAWKNLMGGYPGTEIEDRWKCINFAPCYEGIPTDFDADKALINNRNYHPDIFETQVEEDGDYFTPIFNGVRTTSGFSLAELSEEMTCDETFDLRSYLMRPVVNVKRTLEACFRPENNGGYQVKLDDHFFNWDNPYWTDGWVTLPQLRNIDMGSTEAETITGATITNLNSRLWEVNFDTPSLSYLSNAKLKVSFHWTPSSTVSNTRLYTDRTLNISTGPHIFQGETYVKKLINTDGICVQLWALDMNNNIVAASDAYLLGGTRNIANSNRPLWEGFYENGVYPDIVPENFKFVSGQWLKNGNRYDFCDADGNGIALSFSLNSSVEYVNLQLKIKLPFSSYLDFAWRGEFTTYYNNYYNAGDSPVYHQFPLYTSQSSQRSGDYTRTQAMDVDRVWGTLTYDVEEFHVTATDYEGFFSGTLIPKDKLLATSYSPADFLISYAKIFGLYFYRDPAEVADDPVLAPNGVIHIMDRDTFYTDEYVDLQDRIDRSRDMTITPAIASTKWYSFSQEAVESEAENDYKATYGHTYGQQLVNTNYEFDNKTTNLYDGTVFKSGIMVREKDKYFVIPEDGLRNCTYNGVKYTLFSPATGSGYDTVEREIPVKVKDMAGKAINTLGLTGYDLMPKLQCHGKENEGVDGDGVLLFYKGKTLAYGEGQPFYYWLTDDVLDMMTLNGGTPCWLFCNDEYAGLGDTKVAIRVDALPAFTRDMINFGWQEGNIVHSWNFGHPKATFVPNTYTTDGDSIYDKCWKSYIRDLYDIDNRRLSCYVNLQGQPSQEWFRKWFWFDNSIWRLNEIKDWNAAGNETTYCEFIKVQDVDNYKLDKIKAEGFEEFTLDADSIGPEGGTISGRVMLQSGGQWFSADSDGLITGVDEQGNRYWSRQAVSPIRGVGNTEITVTIPPSSAATNITWTIRIEDDYDNSISQYVTQYPN